MFSLHPDLQKGTYPVAELKVSRLLLIDDERYPWVVLVPRFEGVREIYELPQQAQVDLLGEITHVSQVLAKLFKADKINVAALGNVTPQLHVHVIARFTTDDAWPTPVWGRHPAKPYAKADAETRAGQIANALVV